MILHIDSIAIIHISGNVHTINVTLTANIVITSELFIVSVVGVLDIFPCEVFLNCFWIKILLMVNVFRTVMITKGRKVYSIQPTTIPQIASTMKSGLIAEQMIIPEGNLYTSCPNIVGRVPQKVTATVKIRAIRVCLYVQYTWTFKG